MKRVGFVIFLALVCFPFKFCWAEELNIEVRLDKEEVKVGEVFQYQVSVSGKFKVAPLLIAPKLENFRILSRQQSYNFKIQKGELKSNVKFILSILPLKEGEFELKGFRLKFGFKVYQIQPVKIEVKGVKEMPIPKEEEEPIFPRGEGIWI